MELKDAFQVIADALEAGNKNGAFTLTNAAVVYQAFQVVGKALDLPKEEEAEVVEIPEKATK